MKHLKTYKIFEGHTPNKFAIESGRIYSQILPDIKDILLELTDIGVSVTIDPYIDDVIFEVQVNIEPIETSEQKQLAEDSIFRLEDFLNEHNIFFSKIEMIQFESGNRHDFEIYDMEEIKDLKNTAGEVLLYIYFSKHND